MNKKILKTKRFKQSAKLKVMKTKRKLNKENIEDQYEEAIEKINEEENPKRIRFLLPVKTKDGSIKKRLVEEEITEHENESEDADSEHEEIDDKDDEDGMETTGSDNELIARLDLGVDYQEEEENGERISEVKLMARRSRLLNERKIRIGLLASSILENPENKIRNLKVLVDMMEENTLGISVTVKKLVIASLFEIFKDLLPSYRINQVKQEGVKYKKDTVQLQNYEVILLKYYKNYLQKLEKLAGRLWVKRGDTRKISEPEFQIGELAISCMCDLLAAHSYFNFSLNITNFLVPLINNKRPSVREIVAKCFSQVFKEDKKAELTLTIVRKINQLIKSKGHSVHTEVLSVLLALRLKDINLDKEREEDQKQKKLMNHKQRVLSLSKREKKKNKKLAQIEKELLETKAEENKEKSHKILTEITSIVFTIYFRILKEAPNSKLLSVCLEGLAKFAHCINLDFYQDLVAAINKLMEDGHLRQREQLHCIQTVFKILAGQGSALNIDPQKFYSHLYRILLETDIVNSEQNCELLIKCLVLALINRRKRVTQNRMIAFVKRIMTISLQLQHHGALGLLGIVKSIFQLYKSVDILLDTDSSTGDGIYQPELTDPEYCNAQCTSLWELVALQRHYHSVVQKVSKNIAVGVPSTGEGSLPSELAKLSPVEFYSEYNPSELVFNPAVTVPKKVNSSKKVKTFNIHFANDEFNGYIEKMKSEPLVIDESIDFYKALGKNR